MGSSVPFAPLLPIPQCLFIMDKGFRSHYNKSYKDFENILRDSTDPYHLHRSIMYELRMYASLLNRDCRKILINENSICEFCKSKEKLHMDHILPISKGGKNEISNIQILCQKCNSSKSNKIL